MHELATGGMLAISIDVTETAKSTAKHIGSLLKDNGISATWAVAQPAQSNIVEPLMTSSRRNEIALLGDATWVGRQAGRTTFARELSRRVMAARSFGIELSTLAIQDVDLDGNLDLLVKHRIVAVRGGKQRRQGSRLVRPYSLRFGVWQVSASHWLPGNSQWWQGGDTFSIKRAISRAAIAGDFLHVAIDAAQMAVNDSGLRNFQRIIRHARGQMDCGLLTIQSLGSVAHAMTQSNQAPVNGSILRAA